MTPARGLSFLRFSRPPHQPHLPPHFPAPSSHLRSAISHPAPLFPHKRPACFPPGHGFLPSYFPTQKAREILPPGQLFPLTIPSGSSHPSPHFSHLHPARNTPQRASTFPTQAISPIPFSHTKSPEASRLRADISHVCPSLGTPFFRCRAAPYSLKSSSVNWEVRRGGATRGSRIRGSYW